MRSMHATEGAITRIGCNESYKTHIRAVSIYSDIIIVGLLNAQHSSRTAERFYKSGQRNNMLYDEYQCYVHTVMWTCSFLVSTVDL